MSDTRCEFLIILSKFLCLSLSRVAIHTKCAQWYWTMITSRNFVVPLVMSLSSFLLLIIISCTTQRTLRQKDSPKNHDDDDSYVWVIFHMTIIIIVMLVFSKGRERHHDWIIIFFCCLTFCCLFFSTTTTSTDVRTSQNILHNNGYNSSNHYLDMISHIRSTDWLSLRKYNNTTTWHIRQMMMSIVQNFMAWMNQLMSWLFFVNYFVYDVYEWQEFHSDHRNPSIQFE